MFPAEAQRAASHVKLETAVCRLGNQPVDQCGWVLGLGCVKLRQQCLKPIVVNRAAIVRIGEAEVPDFRSLVEIGQARSCDL